VRILSELGAERGFGVIAVEPLRHAGRPISSTWIREALGVGDVGLAQELLGRPYCIEGMVVSGMRRGRQLGFPTANVIPPEGRALPADGVYFAHVALAGRQEPNGNDARETAEGSAMLQSTTSAGSSDPGFAVVNLGARPTFDEPERILEAHVLDYRGDLYGSRLNVCFLRQIRGIQRFAGVDELRDQIGRDVALARDLAQREPEPAT
jgi:riboflavin kinase/FMN adenylyltransferase